MLVQTDQAARAAACPRQYGDPLLGLIRARHAVADGWLIAGAGVASAVVLLGGPLAAGAPLGPAGSTMAILYSGALVPLGAWVYLALPDTISANFRQLVLEGVIGPARPGTPKMAYDKLLLELDRDLASPWWVALAMCAVPLFWAWRPLAMIPADVQGQVYAQVNDPVRFAEVAFWLRVALVVAWSPLIYGTLLSVLRLARAILLTVRVLRGAEIRLNPLATDGAAGLGGLGRMLTFLLTIATILGMTAVAMSVDLLLVGLDPFSFFETRLLVAAYAVLLPCAFVVWLWQPHLAMLEARSRLLQPLATAFLDATQQSQLSRDALKSDTDYLSELKRRYELLEQLTPTWPLRVPALRGLSLTALLPLLSGSITLARELVLRKPT